MATLTCYYCKHEFDHKETQWDHFPIPKRHGGEHTVAACNSCHHIKDRTPLHAWCRDWIEFAIKEPGSRYGRIYNAIILYQQMDLFATYNDLIALNRMKEFLNRGWRVHVEPLEHKFPDQYHQMIGWSLREPLREAVAKLARA